MGDTNGAKYKHILYNLNWVKKKSGRKYEKAMDRYIDILKKEAREGETKWVYKTKQQALARFKKYGITMDQVKAVMERRGLKDLEKFIK